MTATATERLEVCLGFDGSDSDDWTVIRAERHDGFMFTPTYGPDASPTIWRPEDGRIQRTQVHAAVDELFTRYQVRRMYCDPPYWQTEIEEWALKYGDKTVIPWETYRAVQMHSACERFLMDLRTGSLTHDDCRTTAAHMANTRKMARSGERYVLSKPIGALHQKIDAAVTSVVCHEAACDQRAAGWGKSQDSRILVFRR